MNSCWNESSNPKDWTSKTEGLNSFRISTLDGVGCAGVLVVVNFMKNLEGLKQSSFISHKNNFFIGVMNYLVIILFVFKFRQFLNIISRNQVNLDVSKN